LIVGQVLRFLIFFVARLGAGSCLIVFIGQSTIVFRRVSDQHIWRHRNILNRFSARRVVLRDRKNQRGAVRHFDQFLHRAIAESLVSHDVAARVFENGGGHNFGGSGCAPIHQHCYGKLGDVLGGIGVESLARILLPLQISNRSVVQEKISGGDALGFHAPGRVAQIEHQLLRALLLQVGDLSGDFLRFSFGERVHLNVADVVSQHFFADRRNGNDVARDHNLLRFRTPRTHYR